jgi:hypothetical protein
MRLRDNHRAYVGGSVALALIGLWLGHTLEYLRVWGTAGLQAEFLRSVHAYMVPLGAAIAAVCAVAGIRLWRVWAALGLRLDAARWSVRRLFRGATVEAPSAAPHRSAPSLPAGVLAAWPPLAVLQICLYLLQENVEALAGGAPPPGFGAITGVHALAPPVHAGVSLVLVLAAALALRLVRRRAKEVALVEAVVRAFLRTLFGRPLRLPSPPSRDVRAPLQLLGLLVRQRPPPTPLSV